MIVDIHSRKYCIRIKEWVDSQWVDCFGDLQIEHTLSGETLICGPFIDQTALHGLLDLIRDLTLTLIAVTPVES